MAATKLKLTLVTLAIVGVVTLFVLQQQSHTLLLKKNESLQRQVAQLYSAPVIRSEISGGKAQITGKFSQEEAEELAARITEAIKPK